LPSFEVGDEVLDPAPRTGNSALLPPLRSSISVIFRPRVRKAVLAAQALLEDREVEGRSVSKMSPSGRKVDRRAPFARLGLALLQVVAPACPASYSCVQTKPSRADLGDERFTERVPPRRHRRTVQAAGGPCSRRRRPKLCRPPALEHGSGRSSIRRPTLLLHDVHGNAAAVVPRP